MEDVAWHMKNENLFGSAGDDGRLVIWDTRTNQMQHQVKVHEKEVKSHTLVSSDLSENLEVANCVFCSYGRQMSCLVALLCVLR